MYTRAPVVLKKMEPELSARIKNETFMERYRDGEGVVTEAGSSGVIPAASTLPVLLCMSPGGLHGLVSRAVGGNLCCLNDFFPIFAEACIRVHDTRLKVCNPLNIDNSAQGPTTGQPMLLEYIIPQ